jgi:AraC-like DNA-binding protein
MKTPFSSSLMKPKSQFYHRLTQLHEYTLGEYKIEENFWVNRKAEEQTPKNFVYCFAYGLCRWRNGCSVPFESRNAGWSFEYIIEGQGMITYDGASRELKAGSLFIHAPYRGFNVEVAPGGLLVKKVVLLLGNATDYFCNMANLGATPYLEVEDKDHLNAIYTRIEALASEGSSYLTEDMAALSYSLILEVSRIAESQKYPRVLAHAIDYIECHLRSNITLSSLSAECRMNSTALSRLFHKYLNVSPINYLISRRLEQARHLICMKGLTFKEIADQCGYKRESFFSRAFKQKYGLAPDAYRKSLTLLNEDREYTGFKHH